MQHQDYPVLPYTSNFATLIHLNIKIMLKIVDWDLTYQVRD